MSFRNRLGLIAAALALLGLVSRLNAEIATIMAMPDARQTLLRQGLVPATSSPAELAALIKSDHARWAKVIAGAHIRAD